MAASCSTPVGTPFLPHPTKAYLQPQHASASQPVSKGAFSLRSRQGCTLAALNTHPSPPTSFPHPRCSQPHVSFKQRPCPLLFIAGITDGDIYTRCLYFSSTFVQSPFSLFHFHRDNELLTPLTVLYLTFPTSSLASFPAGALAAPPPWTVSLSSVSPLFCLLELCPPPGSV